QERDQDVGEHVAGQQDATVREEDRGVTDGVRLMLDDLARNGSAVRGQRGDEPEQLERDARRALRRHLLPPLPGFTGSVGPGGRGIAEHVAEARVPQLCWVEKPATTGRPSRSRSSASSFRSEPSMPGSTRTSPPSPRIAMALLQTHALCRTQTPSATSFSMVFMVPSSPAATAPGRLLACATFL